MKKQISLVMLVPLLVLLFSAARGLAVNAQGQAGASPSPTYDPLKEPPVPENPNNYELGQNWYWHYCMPCHGDKGQGLTDEWRAVWEPDHQDCWGKGCHAGERLEDSFKIPTVVPPIVSGLKLARFSSFQALSEYLENTHPPQNPGCLEGKQYQAIAVYLFSENDRPLVAPSQRPPATATYTFTPLPEPTPVGALAPQANTIAYVGLGAILLVALIWGLRKLR